MARVPPTDRIYAQMMAAVYAQLAANGVTGWTTIRWRNRLEET